MGRLPQLLCFLLALAWVPLTQHCGLEALGVLATHCSDAASTDSHGCAGDGCKQVENGGYKPSSGSIKVPAPQLLVCACALCLNLGPLNFPVLETAAAPSGGRPFDWVPSWLFVRRAAPPSRAPSLV